MTTLIKTRFMKPINKCLEWSVYLIPLAIPFSKSLIEIVISIGIILLIAKKILGKDLRLPSTAANLPILLVFLTAALSLFNSQYMDLSLRALFSKNLKFIALYFLVVEAIDSDVKLMNLLKMCLLAVVVVFIDILIQNFITHIDIFHNYPAFKYYLVSNGKDTHYNLSGCPPTGPFPFPNDLSAWLLIIVPVILSISVFDMRNKNARYPLLTLSLIGIYILVLAKARAAWIAFIAVICLLIFLIKKKIALLLLLVVMLVLIMACFSKTSQHVFGFSSMKDRGSMWSYSIRIFKEHPIIGNGINTFYRKYEEIREDEYKGKKGSYSHNCYLQIAADTGILGLGAFLWFVSALLGSSIKFLQKLNKGFYHALILGLISGISAFLIHSFFDTNLFSLNLTALFWASAGLLTAVTAIAKGNTL